MSGKHSDLEELIDELCGLRDVASLFAFITNRVADEIAALGLDPGGVMKAKAFLARVHFGASEDEVVNVSGLLPLAWVILKTALEPFLVSYDGRIRFNHQLVELAADAGLSDELGSRITESALVEYRKEPYSTARTIELMNWSVVAGDDAGLSSVVFSPTAFPVLLHFDADGLRKALSRLFRDEELIAGDVSTLVEEFVGDLERLYDLCLALSRSGCVRSCVAAVDQAAARGQSNADLLTLKARAVYQQGEYAQISAVFGRARYAMKSEGRDDTKAYARLLLQQTIAEKSAGRGRLALEMAQEASRLFERLGDDSSDSLWCSVYKAALELSYGCGAGPEAFKGILDSQRLMSGEKSYAYYRLMCYSWQPFLLAGDLSEADSLTDQSLRGLYGTSGEGPDYAWALTNRATVEACLGLRDEAIEHSRESARLNAQTAVGGTHVYSITGTMNEILLSYLGEISESGVRKASENALESLGKLRSDALAFHEESHPYVLNVEANTSLVELFASPPDAVKSAAEGVRAVSKRLMIVLQGDNIDSLFLDVCAWSFDGLGDRRDFLSRYAELRTKDYVLERILEGGNLPQLRLAVNNGAALYFIPSSR